MWNKFRTWANADVEVNCLWYYVLLGAFFLEAIGSVISWF